MSRNQIILVYPTLGMSGALVQHLPLSLLYAGIDSIKSGYEVDILDVRLSPESWQQDLSQKISDKTLMLGLSVMTGSPIRNALDITRWMKTNHPDVTLVWGGPHATFNGAEILDEPGVDYVIASYGSKPLAELSDYLSGKENRKELSKIAGVIYRDGERVVTVPPENRFEMIDYRDIPYHLIESDLHHYGQLESDDVIFSMYSVMGCPYKCTFCSSPAQYKDIKRKYEVLEPAEVADHIEYVQKKFGATYIYFIDDDSFARLSHVEAVIDEINRRGIKIGLGFRGARINEIKKMSDEYLSKLASAGTNIMHIGAESGSQKILDLLKKNCTVEDIIEVNRKMARHPEIKTAYNWIVGLPGEDMDDLRQSRELILTLLKDNPSALIFIPNKFRPLPGTVLYELAVKYGYSRPERLEDWIDQEAEGDYRPPWYSDELADMISMMQVTSYFVDDKVSKVKTGSSLKFKIIKFLARLYAPFARFRVRHGLSALLIEYRVFNWYTSRFRS